MVWNNEMKRSAVVDYMRYQGKNEAKKAALRQVQLIMGGILKGEQYVALDGWKRHFAQYQLHSLQGLMTSDQATLQKNFALQRLRQTLNTMLRGRQARSLFSFYQNCVSAGELSQQEILQVRLERAIRE